MKTPYVGGRVQPKAKQTDTDARVLELQAVLVRERINHKNDLHHLSEEYAAKMRELEWKVGCAAIEKQDAMQRQRWYMGFLCFLFLIAGMMLGTALAPFNLR